MKKVAISGASGFVGKNLQKFFGTDFEIVEISREKLKLNDDDFMEFLEGCEVIINLAGAPIIKRWSEEYKKLLRSSRIDTTTKIVNAIKNMSQKPKLLISTSAVGIYANKRVYTEEDFEYSNDFLSTLCQEWESIALSVNDITRVAVFRFGIVIGKDGGALSQMLTPFKLGVGGVIGDGSQGFSFIHIDDLMSAYKFVIENENLSGVFNLSSPNPTTNRGLTKALGEALHRPTIFPLPEFVLNLIFGEGARVLTDGQQMLPKKLLDSGFKFKYEDILSAVKGSI
jgi:hypothetical protein